MAASSFSTKCPSSARLHEALRQSLEDGEVTVVRTRARLTSPARVSLVGMVPCTSSESPGQVFGRDEILQRVWPETAVQDDALRRVVALLRRVLDDDPKAPRYIETITRRGYRLVAPVSHPDPKPNVSVSSRAPGLLLAILLLAGLGLATGWLVQRGDAPVTQPDQRPLTETREVRCTTHAHRDCQ